MMQRRFLRNLRTLKFSRNLQKFEIFQTLKKVLGLSVNFDVFHFRKFPGHGILQL